MPYQRLLAGCLPSHISLTMGFKGYNKKLHMKNNYCARRSPVTPWMAGTYECIIYNNIFLLDASTDNVSNTDSWTLVPPSLHYKIRASWVIQLTISRIMFRPTPDKFYQVWYLTDSVWEMSMKAFYTANKTLCMK